MNDHDFRNFKITRDSQGVLTAAFDLPGRSVNVFDESVISELHRLVEGLAADPTVRLVVFTSAKPTGFIAGADIRGIQALQTREEAELVSSLGQQLFEKIEHLPMPTLAVVRGVCLGGGLEFALACRFRAACDDSRTRLGFPEVELGLLPGWGGTQRLPQLIGLAAALPMILEGRKLSARKALGAGLVDLASPPETFDADVARLVADLLAGRAPARRTPGVLARCRDQTRLGQWFVLNFVRQKIAGPGKSYPALPAALDAVQRGLWAGRAAGLAAEHQAFARLLFTPTCRNLIELFFARERARSSASWVKTAAAESRPVERVAVIGAGVMGAGIAQLAAFQGLQVVLKDVQQEFVAAGMQRIREQLEESTARGQLTAAEAAARLAAITPCTDWSAVAAADVAIEAVVEQESVKCDVFRELDRRLPPGAVLTSNTSALSIQHLAEATGRPDRTAGLHFFNPVHRMQLVEVVRTAATSEDTIGILVGLVRQLGKTPVVVADSPGFLVNRILFPYLDEAVRMVCEGAAADAIDREIRRFGMPMGPLELLDQVGLDVAAHVARSLAPLSNDPGPTPERLAAMAARGWLGRKSGCGFYHYANGHRGKPAVFPATPGGAPRVAAPGAALAGLSPTSERLVLLFINEAARCLGEQIVEEPWVIDLAMVLGTGFAPFRGGPLRCADAWGVAAVADRLEQLRQTWGARFAPSATLQTMREAGLHFFAASAEPLPNAPVEIAGRVGPP